MAGITRKSGGKLYYSVPQFAKEVGVTRTAVYTAIKNGTFPVKKFRGDSTQYIELEEGKRLWAERKGANRKTIGQQAKEAVQSSYESLEPFIPDEPKDLEIKHQSDMQNIENIGEITDGENTYSIGRLDPNEFSDCRIYSKEKGSYLKNPETGEYIYNWDLVDKKLKALIHNIQYKIKLGELIPKDEVDYCLSMIFQPLIGEIDQIPHRYISRFIAVVEEQTRTKLPANIIMLLQKEMGNTTKKISESFQEAVRKVLEQ